MRPRLVLATANAGKVRELKEAMAGLDIELLAASELGVTSYPAEDGARYEDNALIKAAFTLKATGLPSLADDSGLEVAALEGAPGVLSARFGAEDGAVSDGERTAYLLEKLTGVPLAKRQAKFVAVLALVRPGGEAKLFRGECQGEILAGPRGDNGFGYDPVFYSHDLAKSFAEATVEEKRRVSHRGLAMAGLLAWLKSAEGQTSVLAEGSPSS